jgi:tol-pal system protein YbgF
MSNSLKKIFLVIAISSLSYSSFASEIKSRTFGSEGMNGYEHDQIDMLKRDIKGLNNKVDRLSRELAEIKAKISISADSGNIEQRPLENIHAKEESQASMGGSEKQIYDLALAALKGRDFASAAAKFEEFFELYPKSQLTANAHYWYGETFYKQKIYDKSALQFLKSYKSDSKGPKAQESMIKLSYSLSELGKTKDSCTMIKKFKQEFPKAADSKMKKILDLENTIKCGK